MVKEQAGQIQKVNAKREVNASQSRTVLNDPQRIEDGNNGTEQPLDRT